MSDEADEYDEFGMLADNAAEAGLPLTAPPSGHPGLLYGRRRAGGIRPGLGRRPAELVLLHGGGQNAHTWDTVALALGRPLLAVEAGPATGTPAAAPTATTARGATPRRSRR